GAGVCAEQDSAIAPVHHAVYLLPFRALAAVPHLPDGFDGDGICYRHGTGLFYQYARFTCCGLCADRVYPPVCDQHSYPEGYVRVQLPRTLPQGDGLDPLPGVCAGVDAVSSWLSHPARVVVIRYLLPVHHQSAGYNSYQHAADNYGRVTLSPE